MATTNVFDLLIIGAGPAGLALAAGASFRGVKNIAVAEQAREFAPVGQLLDLQPNARMALRMLHPGADDVLDHYKVPLRGSGHIRPPVFHTVTVSGREIARNSWENFRVETGETPIPIRFWQLQGTLRKLLPPSTKIFLNHQLEDLQQDGSDIVRATFAKDRPRNIRFENWDVPAEQEPIPNADTSNVDRVTLCARIVIAADGINSVARRCIYRDVYGIDALSKAVYTGLVRIQLEGSFNLAEPHVKFLADRYADECTFTRIYPDDPEMVSMGVNAVLAIPTTVPGKCVLIMYAMKDHKTLNESRATVFEKTLQSLEKAGFPPEFLKLARELFKETVPTKIVVRPMYIVPVSHPLPYQPSATAETKEYPTNFSRPWCFGRVQLIGDALHAVPPCLGLGSAMAFEDAIELVLHMGAEKAWPASEDGKVDVDTEKHRIAIAFENFKRVRMERLCKFQSLSMNTRPPTDTISPSTEFHMFTPSITEMLPQ